MNLSSDSSSGNDYTTILYVTLAGGGAAVMVGVIACICSVRKPKVYHPLSEIETGSQVYYTTKKKCC